MNREEEIKVIINELVKLKSIIENENKLNLTDKNIFLEDIVSQVINIMYEYSLKNTNLNICNYPCIDLIDENKKVAVQVTTNVTHAKIQSTLDKFFEKEYDKNIDQIKFVIFQNTTYRGTFKTERNFKFCNNDDIITFDKLLSEIKSLDEVKLKKLYDYINIALVKNIYTTNWIIDNTIKSLNNLGKRYNKTLDVFNQEEEKLKAFFIEEYNKKKVIELLIDLIINIENNGIYTGINTEKIINDFSANSIEKIKKQLEIYKGKVMEKKSDYRERRKFETYFTEKIQQINFLLNIFSKKTLIYTGEAGIGKSHTLATFIYKYYVSENNPAILLLGQEFVTSENIETQMAKIMNYNDNLKDLCNYINNIAISRNIIIPIIIDGINESNDKSIWKKGLINFIKTITNFSNLKLILSLRETYYRLCISEEIENIDKLEKNKHDGFGSRGFEAAKEFFDFYNIPVPITQLINREFSNPLFLSIYCEIVSKYKINMNEFKYDNFINIYDSYLEKVNQLVIDKYEIQTQKNIVIECLNAISRDSIIKNKYNSYEDALSSIKEIAERYDIKKTDMLNELINNGILYRERRDELEVLIFTYERYEKISKAEYLLSNIKSYEDLNEQINSGNLHDYFDISDKFDNGILEELLIMIPMKYKKDIFEIVDLDKISFKYYLDSSYINSLIWLKNYYNINIIVDNLKRLFQEDYDEQLIGMLMKCSYICTNPCNIKLLHRYLINFSMPELDYKWTTIIENYYDNFNKTTIDNIINYCITYGNEYLDEETIYLIAIMLSWLLSSTNKELRDKSTKALVRMLINKNNISKKIVEIFQNVKDLYILERIIAAIYGAIIRSERDNDLKELANSIYTLIYRNEHTLDNIAIKIYARKLFRYLKINNNINLYDKIDKEKKSDWYQELPTNEEIDKMYSFDIEECSEDPRKFANTEIINSMVTEYGRGTCGYGDFGRYTLQPMLQPFAYNFEDIQLLANIATKRAFEYGYDYTLFGEYDRNVKMYQTRSENYVERIGKKYQWIATFEVLSKLYDNYVPQYDVYSNTIIDFQKRKYYDKNHIQTKIKSEVEYVGYNLEEEYPHVLYIDTTNFILKQNDETGYLEENRFEFEEEKYEKFLVKDFFGEKYISLFNLYSLENRKISSNMINRKAFTISQTAYVYKNKDELLKSNFHKFSQGTYVEFYNIELFDIPFSKKYLTENLYNNEYFDLNNGYKICYQEYIWEKYQDESIENSIKILLPAKWVIEEFDLKQKSEGKWYNETDLICFDSSNLDIGTGLWIRHDYFAEYLKKNNLKMGWTIYSEKSQNKEYKSWRSDVFTNENISEFSTKNYKKEEWKSNFTI